MVVLRRDGPRRLREIDDDDVQLVSTADKILTGIAGRAVRLRQQSFLLHLQRRGYRYT